MTKETKIKLSITTLGVLMIATGNPLMIICGVISVLVIPMEAWLNWVDGPEGDSK